MEYYLAGGPVVAGGTGTDTRVYGYDARGRVTTEPFYMVSSPNTSYLANGPQTSIYQFDNNTESGIGVRTLQYVNPDIGDEVTGQDNFQRATTDLSASLSNVGVNTFTPWSPGYDQAGNVNTRNIVVSGTTEAAQTLTWDAWGRLVKVSQRDSGANDFDWTAVYDGFGRRLQTTWQPMISGSNYGASSYIQYYFDPQVEFLELGWNDNGGRMWKVYGPDTNGVYGGQQGCGGLENEIWEAQSWCYVPLNNEFGDAEGYLYLSTLSGSANYSTHTYGLPLGEYGCEPGQYLYNNGVNNTVLPTPQWRGHYVDETGFVWMGSRYYEPLSGKFLSPDPLGNGASMSLYDYCGGDGVNGVDPDGRHTIEAGDITEGPTYTGGVTVASNSPENPPQPGAVAAPGPTPSQAEINGWNFNPPGLQQAAGIVIAGASLFFGGPASYEGVNGGTDYAGITNTSALSPEQQVQNNQNISNATGAFTVAGMAVTGAYQAPMVTAPAPAGNAGPIELQDGDVILAVVQNGQIIATSTPALSHAELVNRQFGGEVPPGAEVVTIVKANGQVTAITSMTYSGTQVPASAAAQAAAKAAYQ